MVRPVTTVRALASALEGAVEAQDCAMSNINSGGSSMPAASSHLTHRLGCRNMLCRDHQIRALSPTSFSRASVSASTGCGRDRDRAGALGAASRRRR